MKPSWELTSKDARQIPVKILDYANPLSFCPSKLMRDDPVFVRRCQALYVTWKSGLNALSEDGILTSDDTNDLYLMISTFEELFAARQFQRLGWMFSGDPDKAKKD